MDEQIIIIKDSHEKQDRETIGKEAHKIRGGAANLTAMPLSVVAEELESLSQDGDFDQISEHLMKLQKEIDKLKQFV